MASDKNIIIGFRAVTESIKAGKEFQKIFFRKGMQGESFRELFSIVNKMKIPFQFVPDEKLKKITGKNHQGVIALVSPIDFYTVESILPVVYEEGRDPFFIMLDGITDIHNFGAIARTAECAGVDAIIIPSKGSAAINSGAFKTSAGALNHIPICRTSDPAKTLDYLKDSGLMVVAATEKADDTIYQTDFRSPLVLIMGSEDTGISGKQLKQADHLVKIPVYGEISSLNVSVAASVIIYEAIRQRISDIKKN